MPGGGGGGGIDWNSGKSPDDFAKDIQSFRSTFVDYLAVEMRALKEAGVQLAKSKAPVDTGDLRDSIDGAVDRMAKAVIISLSASADHAPYQEFGTIYQSAQPYLRPALQALAPMVVKRVSSAWERAWRTI